jgi:3-methylcrotonyl-CoA carboxylase alpha subunit
VGAETFVVRDAEGNEFRVASSPGGVTVNGDPIQAETIGEGAIRLSGDGAGTAYSATVDDAQWVFLNGEVFRFEIERAGSRRRRSAASHGSLTAPMPATVRRIEAQMGQPVRRGDILIVLEAMKMELPVRAPADGTIARVNCREGELVQAGQELVELQP